MSSTPTGKKPLREKGEGLKITTDAINAWIIFSQANRTSRKSSHGETDDLWHSEAVSRARGGSKAGASLQRCLRRLPRRPREAPRKDATHDAHGGPAGGEMHAARLGRRDTNKAVSVSRNGNLLPVNF